MQPYAYPDVPHVRRHGPKGYSDYESYRAWLRDDFTFHCVYCLSRERWHKGAYGFQVDHIIPEKKAPSLALDYDNLAYACETCNALKSDADGIPDPCDIAYGKCFRVNEDGTIVALNSEGSRLIRVLRLDNTENTDYRRLLIDVLRLARQKDTALYTRLLGFPDDLPNLARKRPPAGNSRPAGIKESCHARRARKELPETY
jgi:hypothetical protein